MYCPECRTEYREGFFECADCEVALVKECPPEPTVEFQELVTVLRNPSPAMLAIAKSVLGSADIPYLDKSEMAQDLVGCGRMPGGFNPIIGGVQLQVPAPYVEEAQELLSDLTKRNGEEPADGVRATT